MSQLMHWSCCREELRGIEKSSALLQLKQEFEEGMSSEPVVYYPGQVVGLNLGNSWLSGILSPNSSLFSLHHLQKLNLSMNGFIFSTIPSSFSQLVRLSHLDLSFSNFTGQIPSEISWLTHLISLDLSNFNLHLKGKDLEAISKNMTNMRELHLDHVNISSSVPQSLVNLSSLTSLSLSDCSLFGEFPKNVFLLPKLKAIVLSRNDLLIGFLPEFPSGSSLRILDLYSTNFSGKLPNSFGNLESLNLLDLHKANFFGELPNSIGNIESLSFLNLDYNHFSGAIPSSIGNLSQLTSLSLSFNNFIGQPPSTLENLAKLNFISLQSINLHGKIPSFLNNPTQLEFLYLSYNNFDGGFPTSLTNLTKLREIYVSRCNSSSSLSILNLKRNLFQGNLPETFMEGSILTSLDFSYNQIQGKIPRSLVKCRMLEVLNLGNNMMNDTFPFWLESLPELQILILRANGFHGPIWGPHTRLGFSKLRVFDISYNNFSGRLPLEYFKTWDAMLMVHGRDNSQPEYMEDQAPYYKDSIMVMNKGEEMVLVKILIIFTSIDLSNNRFHGEIPDTMGMLKDLIVLNLSSNSFTSHIPSSLGNLTELESLDLSRNKLSGEIPHQLLSLTYLAYLNLSNNQLMGPIPQGGQFWTFDDSSFEGNLGLCGPQLSKKCGHSETPTFEPSKESSFGEWFNWKVVVIGYACGFVIGLLTEHVITSKRPNWFVRTFRVNLRRQR
uniref:Disease resistance R13L4/SHOC-2-like LRR domain-containing protein n=1 Tax=Quercus lobata TaxID=97700 RepID=A0A7N2L7H2_QUELO